MASQTNSTTAGHEDTSNAGGTTSWDSYGSNPDQVLLGMAISYFNVRNHAGFSIPTGSTITGILGTVYRHAGLLGMGPQTNQLRIVKGGTPGSTELKTTSTDWATSSQGETFGGTSNLCGETWTAEDINSDDFGVAFAAVNGDFNTGFLETVSITVNYTPPPDVDVDAVVALVVGNITLAANASFKPVYTAAISLTVSNALLSATVDFTEVGQPGGSGGTILKRIRPTILDWIYGNVRGGGASGANGGSGASNSNQVGCGGQGGGKIVLIAHTILNEGTISCNGGNGGNAE